MQQKSKIKYTPAAIDDMDEIFSYLSEDNIFAAEKLIENFHVQISQLADFPRLGSVLSDEDYKLIKSGYRFILVHPYLIFYKIDNQVVFIHRILHGRRDYLRELFTDP